MPTLSQGNECNKYLGAKSCKEFVLIESIIHLGYIILHGYFFKMASNLKS